MNMLTAIALSPGNKARAISDHGATIVVQQRYDSANHWYQLWAVYRDEVTEVTFNEKDWRLLIVVYHVDPDEGYWRPV